MGCCWSKPFSEEYFTNVASITYTNAAGITYANAAGITYTNAPSIICAHGHLGSLELMEPDHIYGITNAHGQKARLELIKRDILNLANTDSIVTSYSMMTSMAKWE